MGLEDLKIKSTLKEPTMMGNKTNKDFKQQIIKRDINPDILKETDMLLKEDELSLKRKIFKLPKMEGLVHGDPKLSAVYEKLAVEGRDKYGYHWNETLMNIIFNDYVLNSPKYLQKYKMTVPIKKKRRDESGINQIKKDIRKQKGLPPEEETKPKKEKNEGWDVERDGIRRTERTYDTMEENKKEVAETTGAAGAGSFAPALDINENYKVGDTITVNNVNNLPKGYENLKVGDKLKIAKTWKNNVDTVYGTDKNGEYGLYVSDINNLQSTSNDNINETTTSSSSGAYSTAHAWAKQGEEPRMGKKPAWRGGVILESAKKDGTYLTDSNVFQEYVKALTEGIEDDLAGEGMTSPNDDSRVPMSEESMDESLFDNLLDTKNKVSEILAANKDLFNRTKKLHEPMDNQVLVKQFINNSTRVPIKTLISDPETYSEGLVSLLAQYAVMVDRGLQNDPTVAKQLKTIGAIIDPQFLKSMSESVNMNEDHLSNKQEKIEFILQNKDKVFQGNVSPTVEQDLANMSDAEIDALYQSAESVNGVTESESPITENFKAVKLNDALALGLKLTYAKSAQEVRDAMRQFMGLNNVSEEDLLDSIKTLRSNARMMASSGSQATENEALLSEIIYYLTKETDWKQKIGETTMDEKAVLQNQQQSNGFNKVIKSKVESKPVKNGDSTKQWKQPVKESMIDPQNPSMVSGNGTSMVKEPQAPATPAVSSVGGVGESLEESINKELAFYKKHLNNLNQMVNEERRHPALVNLDRVKDANEKNFKSDLKDSNIGDIIDMESQPMSDELTTEVGENPYKLAQDIEKKSLQKTKGEALKNVGNSANEEGDEIPKRNLSKEEMTAVAMNRGKGMQDIVYDNKPSEKFEKRMEKDLGDDIYKLRKEKMEYQTNAPMYNKDAQPTFNDSKKDENNKYKKGYNNESISGKYTDEFGKKIFIDFKLNETVEITKVDSTFQKVSTDGMGNTYTSKIQENQSYSDFSTSFDLFHKEGKIYRVKKSQSLNEGVEKQAPKVENMDKMKHLMGYKPSNYMVNKKIK